MITVCWANPGIMGDEIHTRRCGETNVDQDGGERLDWFREFNKECEHEEGELIRGWLGYNCADYWQRKIEELTVYEQ